MQSSYLLVIDNSVERIQAVNSFLRNAGMAVRVISAASATELETSLREKLPFLVVLGTSVPDNLKTGKVLQAAKEHSVPVAMQVRPGKYANLEAAIGECSVQVIGADDHDQLMEVVQFHLSGGKSARKYDDLQLRLDELQHRYDLLLDSARDAIAYIHEGLHVYANRAYIELLQLQDMSDIVGLSLLELVSTDEGTDLKKLLRDMNRDIIPEDTLPVSVNLPTGQTLKADLTFLPARFNGEKCIQMMVCEQDAKLALREELDRLRKSDQLTQMYNRKTFTEKLADFISGGRNGKLRSAVLYIEPDGMADLDGDIGPDSLDTHILDLSNIIRGCTQEDDLSARYSEFGFTLLIQRAEKTAFEDTANQILENYGNHIIDLGDRTLSASCSIGMATIGSLTKDAREVIDQAKAAFKEAAQKGNNLVTYKPALKTVSSGEGDRDWVERIRHALNNQDFYTVQQSIVDLEGENEGLFENRTFMREDNVDTHLTEFLQVAERNELGAAIDRHVIPHLMAAIAGTGDKHIIPISANSVNDPGFAHWFEGELKKAEVEGSQILLQVSADSAESGLKSSRRLVDEMQAIGCGIVLAEFDNDRRRLQLLEHLPVNMVKLRRGLAHGLSSNSRNQEVIRAVVKATAGSHITIVADEVQDASDLALLWQCGVKLVTGDFLNEAPQVVGQ
jgi:diguanylate cyclase (GGDEF)-like protein